MELKHPTTMQDYASNRDELLEHINRVLQNDGRFVAAWLTGSMGRGDADSVSDIDLTVVVENAFADVLCFRPHRIGAGTTPERYALLSQFGEPHLIHENHHNAPENGSFTFVLYQGTALAVDWTLRPNVNVTRPALSVLLFDKANIAVESPIAAEGLSQRIESATEQVAFFWMMAMVTVKCLIRKDEIYFHHFLDTLHGILWEVRRLVAGKPDLWLKGSLAKLAISPETQIASVRQVCQEMMKVMRDVEKIGGSVPVSPMSSLEILLHLAESDLTKTSS